MPCDFVNGYRIALASLGSCGGLHSHDGCDLESAGLRAVIIAHAACGWKRGGLRVGTVTRDSASDDYTQWDFSSSFDFSEMFGISARVAQLTIDVININDEERRTYSQFSNAM